MILVPIIELWRPSEFHPNGPQNVIKMPKFGKIFLNISKLALKLLNLMPRCCPAARQIENLKRCHMSDFHLYLEAFISWYFVLALGQKNDV